jgi:uncharacterized SAM-binding protein YcdF (DUF218 family)
MTGPDVSPEIGDEIGRLAETLWNYLCLNQAIGRSDCIVGLGSYDLRVAERCAELYKDNWAPLIVFSGNLGNWTRGVWDETEAEVFSRHAVSVGVPAGKIKLERQATNIGENIVLTRELLHAEGIRPESVTLVSKPSTERRVFATARRVWPEVKTYITSPRLTFRAQLDYQFPDVHLVHEMVGDIQRIRLYPKLGFQIVQPIPAEVWFAYERLVSLGYTNHLMADKDQRAEPRGM